MPNVRDQVQDARQSSLFAKVDARYNATAALAMCQASALLRRHRLSFRDVVHQPERAEHAPFAHADVNQSPQTLSVIIRNSPVVHLKAFLLVACCLACLYLAGSIVAQIGRAIFSGPTAPPVVASPKLPAQASLSPAWSYQEPQQRGEPDYERRHDGSYDRRSYGYEWGTPHECWRDRSFQGRCF
jgi:hypothetical protein